MTSNLLTVQFASNKLGNLSLSDDEYFLTKIIVKIYKEKE